MLFFRSAAPVLSLQQFDIDPTAASGQYVLIRGRPSGFVGWFLSILGLTTVTEFRLSLDRMTHSQSSLTGDTFTTFPLRHINATVAGYKRNPVWLAIASFILLMMLGSVPMMFERRGSAIPFIICFVLLLVVLTAYILSRRLILAVTSSDVGVVIAWKESTVGTVRINREIALSAVKVINDVVANIA